MTEGETAMRKEEQKTERQKYNGSEMMEWIRTGKQTNTRAKVGQLHNVLD